MDYPQTRQTRQPRFAITASFLLIGVFVIWLILPRQPAPQDEILPNPIVSKVRTLLSPVVHRARDTYMLSDQAVVVLNGETVSGTVTFTQLAPTAPVTVSGEIKNLNPTSEHGFHIQ